MLISSGKFISEIYFLFMIVTTGECWTCIYKKKGHQGFLFCFVVLFVCSFCLFF